MGIASSLVNVCRFNPTLGGTTDWAYSSAVTGYQAPTAAGAVVGAQYSFRAESLDLTQWEETIGAWDGTKLVRTTVISNSAGTGTGAGQTGAGTKINFSAAPQVAIVALAEDLTRSTSNRVINGRFNVDQINLGASTVVLTNAYGPDQWRGLAAAGTVNMQAQRSDTGFPGGNGLVLVNTATTKFGLFQPFESAAIRDLIGQNATLSALLAVNNAARLSNVKMALVQFTGTKDAISGNPVSTWNAAGTNPTLATSWSYVNTPANLGVGTTPARFAVSGAVSASANNLGVLIWEDSAGSALSDTISLSDVKLELGATATPFDPRPYSSELDLCQWFLRLTNQTAPKGTSVGGIAMYAIVTSALAGPVQWPTMRAVPTPTIWNNGVQNKTRTTGTGTTVTVTTLNSSNFTRNGFGIFSDTGGAPFTVGQFYDFDLILDARL